MSRIVRIIRIIIIITELESELRGVQVGWWGGGVPAVMYKVPAPCRC